MMLSIIVLKTRIRSIIMKIMMKNILKKLVELKLNVFSKNLMSIRRDHEFKGT